ncbi:DUF1617 family protein [Gracilibacillus lacisalsi]|uniref:DUF1617 family protein n=1 Tax=Gracilibacillus lacisalsi TaxID=393087 RepID=UPI00036121B6|nr:DUF1617 family protein [Gracilibacillus lacisalsi]
MQVKIENRMLKPSIELLLDFPLKGKKSRHRTKFIKQLQDRLKEVDQNRAQLAKEHAKSDEDGEPIVIDDGKRYDIEDQEAFQADLKELYDEALVIDGGDNEGMLKTVKTVLLNSDKEWSGQQAFVYDYLCEQFEKGDEA